MKISLTEKSFYFKGFEQILQADFVEINKKNR